MSKHPENKTVQAMLVNQCFDLYEESIVLSERLLSNSFRRMGLSPEEVKDRTHEALIPVALEIRNQMSTLGQVSDQANSSQIDRMYEAIEKVMTEVRTLNAAPRT
jgi:hypothetical protein